MRKLAPDVRIQKLKLQNVTYSEQKANSKKQMNNGYLLFGKRPLSIKLTSGYYLEIFTCNWNSNETFIVALIEQTIHVLKI